MSSAAASAFMEVANAALRQMLHAPPALRYRVRAWAGSAPSAGEAVCPIPPLFDALAHFEISALVRDDGTLALRVVDAAALQYDLSSQADAVARSVRDYDVAALDDADSGGVVHLRLLPSAALARRSGRWLSDVWYDRTSKLPLRVVWTGDGGFRLDTRYVLAGDAWRVRSVDVVEGLAPWFAGRRLFRAHCDYEYDDAAPPPAPPAPV